MKAERKHYGRRAKDKTQTSISLRTDLLTRAQEEAEGEGRTLSNWLEQLFRARYPQVAAEMDATQKSTKPRQAKEK